MKKHSQRNTEEKRSHPQRINVLVNRKLLIFSPHYHNLQITVSNDKMAITKGQMHHSLGDAVPVPSGDSLMLLCNGSVVSKETH
jgi:hypothetical protein